MRRLEIANCTLLRSSYRPTK